MEEIYGENIEISHRTGKPQSNIWIPTKAEAKRIHGALCVIRGTEIDDDEIEIYNRLIDEVEKRWLDKEKEELCKSCKYPIMDCICEGPVSIEETE